MIMACRLQKFCSSLLLGRIRNCPGRSAPGAQQPLGADLAVGAGAFGVGEAGQGGGCGQLLHQFLGLAGEELAGLAAAGAHRAGDLLGDPLVEAAGQECAQPTGLRRAAADQFPGVPGRARGWHR